MSLYHHHLQHLVERYNNACDALSLDCIALHSGSTSYYPNDDLSHPFHPMPLAQQWLPFDVRPDTWIIFSKDEGLTLIWSDKPDFWHVSERLPEGDWQKDWKILPGSSTKIEDHLVGRIAVLSHHPEAISFSDSNTINPTAVLDFLNFDRAVKTEWEIEQIRLANQRGARGHKAAREAFLAGKSEYEIHMDFLLASQQQQIDEPYGSIVALNEAAATLHYERKQQRLPSTHNTLLIDAGAKVTGYASDITRTFTQGNRFFSDLVNEMDALQQSLCSMCQVGVPYQDIHTASLQKIAALLQSTGLCRLSIDEQLANGITQVFFPHGIGHLLGLNVHDAGGLQKNRQGFALQRPDHAPFLRLMRPLEENTVVTIEPGLYFIPMLLDNMIQEQPNHGCDLKLIESLKPFGGVRIEDNVVAKSEGPLNLTRASFDEIHFNQTTL